MYMILGQVNLQNQVQSWELNIVASMVTYCLNCDAEFVWDLHLASQAGFSLLLSFQRQLRQICYIFASLS
jgi:hypothetical protein